MLLSGLLVATVLTACAGPAGPTASTRSVAPSTAASASTPSAVSSAPAAEALAPTASGWFAGVEISPTKAAYDPGTQRITIDATARNTADTDLDILDDVFVDLGAGGAPATLAGAGATAVKSSTSVIRLVFRTPSGAMVDLSKAVLQLGDVDQERWLVPLAPGKTSTGEKPTSTALTDRFTATRLAFRFSTAEVVPWACDRSATTGDTGATSVAYEPVQQGRRSLLVRVSYTELNPFRGGDGITDVSVTGPDGVTAAAKPQTRVTDLHDTVDDLAWCFVVAPPVSGRYVLRWTTYYSGSATRAITVG